MKKFVLVFSILTFLLLSLPVHADTFSDVNNKTPYKNSIMWMVTNGVINGDALPKTTFRPDDCVNRAEMLKLIYETTGENLDNLDKGGQYSDVFADAWYEPYVNKATLKGVVHGYPDNKFQPDQCVNRAEAMKMAIKEFGIEDANGQEVYRFSDIDNNEWYFEYANTALERKLMGILHVISDGSAKVKFFPMKSMTRKEAAEMLYKMKTLIDNELEEYGNNFEPNPIIRDFSYNERLNMFSGIVEVTGYPEIIETVSPFCDEETEVCDRYNYIYFKVTGYNNDGLNKYFEDMQGNSFVVDNSVGIGCEEDGYVHYQNASDFFGHEDSFLDLDLSTAILNATASDPILITLTKFPYTSGSGAPTCYTHFTKIER